jgi:hypothetical protein
MPRCFALPLACFMALCPGPLPADEPAPQVVTLVGEAIPLGKALADLTRQTGIPVQDRRDLKMEPLLKLELKQVPFWRALDAIARQAGAGVSLYQPDGQVALIEPAPKALPVSYDGIFRSTVKRLTLHHDLESGGHSATVQIEIAWQPPFQPLFLEIRSYEAAFAADAKGRSLHARQRGTGQTAVQGRAALVDLSLPAPDRSAPALAELKGNFTVIGSAKMLTVRFGRLAETAKTGKVQTHTSKEGITVTLRKLEVVDSDRWQADVELIYPRGGPQFESFQDWLVNNRIYLEKGKGKAQQRFEPGPADQQIKLRTSNRAIIRYYFVEEKGRTPHLGSPGDWSLVYQTPSRLLAVPGTFHFKTLALP